MKRNYKLTPDIIKEIEKIATSLPQLQQMNGDKPMFRLFSRQVLGKNIPFEQRKDWTSFNSDKLYT